MKKIKRIFENIKNDYELRSFLTSYFSFLINVAFLTYNLIFGLTFNFVWNWSISIYYALLIIFRAIILFFEKRWSKIDANVLEMKRLKLFKFITCCLVVMDISLIAPITLMVLSKRIVNIGMIPTIAIAAYTTYKVTLSIVSYAKKKAHVNYSIKALRLITLKDAVVSVLTLQNTMVMVFGDGSSMLTLTAFTSAGLLAVLVSITIISIIKAYKKSAIK